MALSEVDNIIEGRASSFPRLRMFVPVLLAGAAQSLKAVCRKAAGKKGSLSTPSNAAGRHRRFRYSLGVVPVALWNARVKLACEEKCASSAICASGNLPAVNSAMAFSRRSRLM